MLAMDFVLVFVLLLVVAVAMAVLLIGLHVLGLDVTVPAMCIAVWFVDVVAMLLADAVDVAVVVVVLLLILLVVDVNGLAFCDLVAVDDDCCKGLRLRDMIGGGGTGSRSTSVRNWLFCFFGVVGRKMENVRISISE